MQVYSLFVHYFSGALIEQVTKEAFLVETHLSQRIVYSHVASKEANKEEIFISDNCFSQTSYPRNLDSFFLNGFWNAVFKACCFKNLFLENVRHFTVESAIYIFFLIAATSRKIKSYNEKHYNLQWNISFPECFWKYACNKNYETSPSSFTFLSQGNF